MAEATSTPAYCRGVYRGDTSVGTNNIEQYACRPDWPETGPEAYYKLRTTFTQPISITLSHPAGIDLDLFLLVDGDPAQCYAADAALAIPNLSSGEHTIVVDGFAGDAGEYLLEIECQEPPFATPTPTAPAPPTATPTPTPPPTATPRPTITPTRPHLTYQLYLPSQPRGYPPPTPEPTLLVLQPGVDNYAGVANAYLNRWENSTNYAKVDRLALRQPDIMAPILRFDLSRIPANAHIVDARLGLWTLAQSNENPATVGLYKVNRPWNVNEVTWDEAAQGDPWASPGANAVPADREGQPVSVQIVDATRKWYEWDVTLLVQNWLRQPEANNGVVLKAFAEPRVLYHFASAGYHNPLARPKLTIRYWTPTPTAFP
ncbi:MAG: DNRLRE domain-containing protein [Chloroflexi bacterium]|nr:DNRLRE domain-containing protein [Chloroflexota bacterium]